MSRKDLIVAILLTLVMGALVSAQVFRPPMPIEEPIVYSGSDYGIRVEARDSRGRIYGKLVVRIDNKWVEVELLNQPALRPLSE